MPNQRRAGMTKVELCIVLGIIILLLALLLPAVQQSRDAARQSTSKNNLKQIGLAFHNYHDTHRCLPPGGVIREEGTAMHGWLTMLLPFLDSSPLYSWTDFNVSWNSPVNFPVFDSWYPSLLNPGEDANFTISGYALTNYLGNPNLLYRNSCVNFKQMEKGLVHTWLAGEVAGNFQAWGYPFNWRPLGTKFCDGPDSFGCTAWDGSHLLLADGSVSFFSDETSPEIMKSLATAPPVATKAQTATPRKLFETGNFQWDRIDLQSDPQGKKKYLLKVLRSTNGKPLSLYLFDAANRSPDELAQIKYKGDRLHYLFEIKTTTEITASLKSTSLVKESTPAQFEANIKTLQVLQKRLQK